MSPQDAIDSIESFVEDQLHFLKPVSDAWQPADFLPQLTGEDWQSQVEALRGQANTLSDEVLVVLVGNLVTEEALPSYQTWLNRFEEIRDLTGASSRPWARWTRGWTAEEKRHGDILSKYLYLSGRVDMRSVEVTIHHLIKNGFDLKSDDSAYKALVYASFQERATRISHQNTGRAAEKCGDPLLAKICTTIAADEARHEEAYKRFFGKILEVDAARGIIAFGSMMKQKIAMPARLMSDGSDCDLFTQFAIVAQRSRIYTTRDYADVIAHLVSYWKVADLRLFGEAAQAQEYVCGLAGHFLDKADKTEALLKTIPPEPFNWIYGRKV